MTTEEMCIGFLVGEAIAVNLLVLIAVAIHIVNILVKEEK